MSGKVALFAGASGIVGRGIVEHLKRSDLLTTITVFAALTLPGRAGEQGAGPVEVEFQPLEANVARVASALEMLGAPLADKTSAALERARRDGDAKLLQQALDPEVLLVVELNPEERVRVSRGAAPAILQQAGYTPVLIKVINESTTTKPLRITSPQSGPVYAGAATLSMQRQDQMHLKDGEIQGGAQGRFLQAEMFTAPPLSRNLSGLAVEYALAVLASSESGRREATLGFELSAGTKDLGFRGEVPVLFEIRPAIPVLLRIRDHDGKPTTAGITFLDRAGHVFPPQTKRLAPDMFFQPQVYRRDGGTVLLPPGRLIAVYGRGPEYRHRQREVVLPRGGQEVLDLQLERWIDPSAYGFYGGDHHIHAAGCAHYTDPSQGIQPEDVLLQVKGEGLSVGCILTWGPCFDYQRRFFSPGPDRLSEPFTVIKYDIEVSGFGSQALGHVCLLNLRDQHYPGSKGTSGWPSWTTPVLRWAKAQGAVTGYAHSASGLEIDPKAASARLMSALDANNDSLVSAAEAAGGLLTEEFAVIDADRDGALTLAELELSHDRVAEVLPNHAIPEMNSVGAMEIFVTVPQGLCDFISAMDTSRIAEWNCWYHLLNCGFPLKLSGETDFPCMSGTRVGQGRVYVQLGRVAAIDFGAWCAALAQGRSYVSDGYAHALEFAVGGKVPGETLELASPGTVAVRAKVAFAARTPLSVAHGGVVPSGKLRLVGDTVTLHGPKREDQFTPEGQVRRVELVVNGRAIDARNVTADDRVHELEFQVPLERSAWVALRHFPQMHTNPVEVRVGGRPIRASRRSARWCIGAIEQLWRRRGDGIAQTEREEARRTFDRAIERYRRIASESPDES